MNFDAAQQLISNTSEQLQASIQMPMVWSIAGSDNTAGAGIQADNKVFERFGVRSANIVTAITAQNSSGLHAMHVCSRMVFNEQWRALTEQVNPTVIKLGMLANAELIHSLIKKLALVDAKVVCDPVSKASTGGNLLQGNNKTLYHSLLNHVDVLTPNQAEFCELFSINAKSLSELIDAAEDISKVFSIDLIITGGESVFAQGDMATYAVDVCVVEGETFFLESPLQETCALHGTGCSFSAAIAASMALGYSVKEAAVLAKAYLNQGLASASMQEEFLALATEMENTDAASNTHFNESNTYPAFEHTQFPYLIKHLPNVVAAYTEKYQLFSAHSELAFPAINGPLGLYPVVDTVEWIEKCLKAGVKTIQLRVKDKTEDELDVMVQQAAALGHLFQARLFINDHWQLAIKHNAYGVHLGQEDLQDADLLAIQQAGLHLGLSTHSWFEIARAHSLRPSYVAIGPIYETTTKIMPWKPQGLVNLTQWNILLSSTYPIVAIGGINNENAEQVLATQVGSIAMVRAITEAPDYVQAINELNEKITAQATAV